MYVCVVCMYVCHVCMCVYVCMYCMYCNRRVKKSREKGNCVCVCHLSVCVARNITYNRVNTTR